MVGFLRFISGLFIGTIFVAGVGAIGYIVFQEFGFLTKLIIAAVIILLVLDITAITSFPRSIIIGLITPQIALVMGLGFYYSQKELSLYFTDDFAYRSCVGNFDNSQGILDCTALLNKLETKGHIVLKEIENTKGNYWIAEVLSYRGRHYIRDKQLEMGKADFSRALLIPEGTAVTINNLAEAGYTRSDIFKNDYDETLSQMSNSARCMASSSRLEKQQDALRFSVQVSSNTPKAIKLCQLSTGRDEQTCDKIVNDRIRSIISLSNKFYLDASNEELSEDHALCLAQ